MDPLSISASIAGLLSLTDTVFARLIRYCKSAKHAGEEIRQLADEVNLLGGAIHSLSRLAKGFKDEPANEKYCMHNIRSCQRLLTNLDTRLRKSAPDPDKAEGISLRWPLSSSRVQEILEELATCKNNITLALSANSMDALLKCISTQAGLETTTANILENTAQTKHITNRIEQNARHRDVETFFLKYNPQDNYETSLRLRHPRTGFWLVDLPEFDIWLNKSESKIWLSGIPGAGKTVLAGTIIQAALTRSSDRVATAFFFCDYKNQRTQICINILCALAYQIGIQNPAAYDLLEKHYQELHPAKGLSKNSTLSGIEALIQDMAALFDCLYIVVDGLDECGSNARDVVQSLVGIAEQSEKVCIALLSRDEDEIRDEIGQDFVPIEIAAHKEDITEYITAEIEKRIGRGKLHINDLEIKGEIVQGLIEGAKGM